jgi:hypothetical protein
VSLSSRVGTSGLVGCCTVPPDGADPDYVFCTYSSAMLAGTTKLCAALDGTFTAGM